MAWAIALAPRKGEGCQPSAKNKSFGGWSKTVGRIRQVMYRGRERVEQLFLLTEAAYNLIRMRTLAAKAA
jgi:hypothetical protein